MNTQILKSKQDVLDLLVSHKISFKEYAHKPAMTIDDLKNDPGKLSHSVFIKNLVYVDKKKAFHFILAHESTIVNKAFWKSVGTTHNNVRFATEDQLEETLNTQKGAVNIFAVLNDKSGKVTKIYLDKKLEHEEYLSFHPQVNTSTLELKQEDVAKLLHLNKKEWSVVDLEVSETVVNEAEEKKKTETIAKDDNETKLKIEFKKEENFGNWYTQVIIKADLIDYYDVSGCYILKPNAYFLWEQIQSHLDKEFKKFGVKNAYFPMFVKKKNLEAEKEHVEGFEAEVAWVTHSGKTQLAEPIAIRPTSETIMYPSFSKWIKSHRDLPLKINQWTNVVRWEFKHPTPFIRTREFLWQEGHTVHATKEESDEMVYQILEVYARCYGDLLAIPVIKGVKSKNEKFAGADYTTTCETFIAENGRAIQACTSHNLGQNFAKMFNVEFEDLEMKKQLAWQTSWGFTTRSIGILVMIHGDDKGTVHPPKIAPIQIVIVPIFFKEKNNEGVNKKCKELFGELVKHDLRVELDDRPQYSAGWKFNDWEMKGVTLRIEVGPNDLEKNEFRLVRRVDNMKKQVKVEDVLAQVKLQLEEAHQVMYKNAQKKIFGNIVRALNWTEFMNVLNSCKIVETPWCEESECEDRVKERSGVESKMAKNEDANMSGAAKTLCMPLVQDPLEETAVCFHCSKKAKKRVLWGRSY